MCLALPGLVIFVNTRIIDLKNLLFGDLIPYLESDPDSMGLKTIVAGWGF